jgi:hypothetical protein
MNVREFQNKPYLEASYEDAGYYDAEKFCAKRSLVSQRKVRLDESFLMINVYNRSFSVLALSLSFLQSSR